MENQNRTVFLVLVAIVIVVAVFSSFGLNLFGKTEEVYFPAPLPTNGDQRPSESSAPGGDQDIVWVSVTVDTVQSVVETLSRPQRYTRSVTVSTYRADGTEDAQRSLVVVADGWTQTETTFPDERIRSTIVGEGTVYRWYGSGGEVKSWPADDRSADLEGQRILTYEDVLALDKEKITDAGYERRGGQTCIYVEVDEGLLGYRSRYWISVSNGLLVEAERTDGDRVFYRMTTGSMEQSLSVEFKLPDGTLLYRSS